MLNPWICKILDISLIEIEPSSAYSNNFTIAIQQLTVEDIVKFYCFFIVIGIEFS